MKGINILSWLILLLLTLAACNSSNHSSKIVGTWEPAEGNPCLDDIAEFKFTEENTVRVLTGSGITAGGKYEKLDEDLFSITFTNGLAIDGVLSMKDGVSTLDLTDNEGDSCQFIKNK